MVVVVGRVPVPNARATGRVSSPSGCVYVFEKPEDLDHHKAVHLADELDKTAKGNFKQLLGWNAVGAG